MLNTTEMKIACLRLALDRPKYAGGIKNAEDLVSEARVYENFILENNPILPIPVMQEKRKGKILKSVPDTILGF
jgi:hypothetical protein